MRNILPHTRSYAKRIIILSGLLFLFANCFAQDTATDTMVIDAPVVPDSVSTTYINDEAPKFDSLTALDVPVYYTYTIPDSVIQNLKKDDAFWYADKTPNRQKPPEIKPSDSNKQPFYYQNWFRILVWVIIIGAFVAVLIWFLIASDVRLFRKKPVALQTDHEVTISEDIFSVNYEQEIEKAIANENYRLGVRLMYLHLLRLFSERDIIQYKIEKTNSDYLFQLYNKNYYKDFFRLTRNFEYVWYGKFDISRPAFEMISQDYTKLKSVL